MGNHPYAERDGPVQGRRLGGTLLAPYAILAEHRMLPWASLRWMVWEKASWSVLDWCKMRVIHPSAQAKSALCRALPELSCFPLAKNLLGWKAPKNPIRRAALKSLNSSGELPRGGEDLQKPIRHVRCDWSPVTRQRWGHTHQTFEQLPHPEVLCIFRTPYRLGHERYH